MKTLIAILITIALLAACVVVVRLTHVRHLEWAMILGTAAWAAIDSSKIGLKNYKSGLPYGPLVLFILIGGFWIVGFPWYLVVRSKIKAGKAILKDNPSSVKSEQTEELPPGTGE